MSLLILACALTAPAGIEDRGAAMTDTTAQNTQKSWLARVADSDLWYSFRRSPVAIVSTIVTILFFVSAIFANWIAPHNPFDLATISIMDASLPPAWMEGSDPKFWLGTDDQGRDIFSTIIFGARISLFGGSAWRIADQGDLSRFGYFRKAS